MLMKYRINRFISQQTDCSIILDNVILAVSDNLLTLSNLSLTLSKSLAANDNVGLVVDTGGDSRLLLISTGVNRGRVDIAGGSINTVHGDGVGLVI